MSAALDHPIGPTTVDDWLAQDSPSDGSRLELIYGYLHVSPPPSGQHQHAAFNLARTIQDALRDGLCLDHYVVPAVGIAISTGWRTALIPDVAVLNIKPVGTTFDPSNVVLVVEVWSPGDSRTERETKMAAYASAGVPFFWVVEQNRAATTVTVHRLVRGRYVEEQTATPGEKVTITAAPVPVTLDPAELFPG